MASTPDTKLCPQRPDVACETPLVCAASCHYNNDPVHPNRVETLLDTKPKKHRVQVEMTPRQYDRLERLRDITDAPTLAQTIHDTIEFRENLQKLVSEGQILYMESPRGEKVRLVIPGVT